MPHALVTTWTVALSPSWRLAYASNPSSQSLSLGPASPPTKVLVLDGHLTPQLEPAVLEAALLSHDLTVPLSAAVNNEANAVVVLGTSLSAATQYQESRAANNTLAKRSRSHSSRHY